MGVEREWCVCEGMSQGRGIGWKKRGKKRCVCEGVVAVRKMARLWELPMRCMTNSCVVA